MYAKEEPVKGRHQAEAGKMLEAARSTGSSWPVFAAMDLMLSCLVPRNEGGRKEGSIRDKEASLHKK